MAEKITTWQVLRNKFPAEEYVLLTEVANTLGNGRARSLDYMVINLWKSRGLSIIGIEQKSNRGDWLKELKDPSKQERHFVHCDFFYLITDRDDVAKLEEIPDNWGWYHVNKNGILKTMKQAPKLQSVPVPRGLLCAMLRRAADKRGYTHQDDLESHIETQVAKQIRLNSSQAERDIESYRILKERIELFEERSGVNIMHAYEIDKIGDAVRIIVNDGVDDYKRRLERMVQNIKTIHDELNLKLITLNKINEPTNTTGS